VDVEEILPHHCCNQYIQKGKLNEVTLEKPLNRDDDNITYPIVAGAVSSKGALGIVNGIEYAKITSK
jgi:hypothetical protein